MKNLVILISHERMYEIDHLNIWVYHTFNTTIVSVICVNGESLATITPVHMYFTYRCESDTIWVYIEHHT